MENNEVEELKSYINATLINREQVVNEIKADRDKWKQVATNLYEILSVLDIPKDVYERWGQKRIDACKDMKNQKNNYYDRRNAK